MKILHWLQQTLDNSYRSNPHRRVEKALHKMGVAFMSENEEFPPYRLDIYLPDYHAAIEVDGPSHSYKKDKARDTWMLERYFVPTLRIKTKGPWQSHAKLESEILAFLEEHTEDVEERKYKWRTMYVG